MAKTIIAEDLHITGNLSGNAEIDVAGRIDGDIKGKSIDILAGGSVSGAVTVTSAQIRGRLTGSLKAVSVELQAGADLKADIYASELEMRKGAMMKGKVEVTSSE